MSVYLYPIKEREMIVIQRDRVPGIGHTVQYDSRSYMIVTQPIKSLLQGGLYKCVMRYVFAGGCIEKDLYIEVIKNQ